jgi:hypothetical protein
MRSEPLSCSTLLASHWQAPRKHPWLLQRKHPWLLQRKHPLLHTALVLMVQKQRLPLQALQLPPLFPPLLQQI